MMIPGSETDQTLPNFLVIGAQKAGSSTLHEHLALHADIFMSAHKELHYFDDMFFTRSFDDYRARFSAAGGARMRGESTPSYLSYPGCAEKIRSLLGNIPLIVIVRDPIARMYSQYWHGMKYGHESLPFTEALAAEDQRRAEMGLTFFRQFDYLSRSAYETHLRKYRELFSRVHLCRLENLSQNPLETLNEIYDFLALPRVSEVAPRAASNPSRMARYQQVNRVLNAYEARLGANRVTGLIRRTNFYPFKYPKLTDEDRGFAIAQLAKICPETVSVHGLR